MGFNVFNSPLDLCDGISCDNGGSCKVVNETQSGMLDADFGLL